MFRNEFVKFEDRLYKVQKVLKAADNPNIEAWKKQTNSDVALQKEQLIYFVQLVPDLEIINNTE